MKIRGRGCARPLGSVDAWVVFYWGTSGPFGGWVGGRGIVEFWRRVIGLRKTLVRRGVLAVQ